MKKRMITVALGSRAGLGLRGERRLARLDIRPRLLIGAAATAIATLGVSVVQPADADVNGDSIVHTIAGDGVRGFSGDGGLAVNAEIYEPRDSEYGPDGSLYFVDTYNHRVRRIAPDGTISTVAGHGSSTYNGDGIPAVNAGLKWPHDLFVDDAGVIYIADSNHHRIRSVTTDGIIHTIAGTGKAGSSGDGGPATKAQLTNPKSVFEFGGYLYTSGLDNKVRRINLSTGIISTYAGTGAAGYADGPKGTAVFNSPQRIQIDSLGNVYVADSGNSRIRRIDAATGQVTTLAGNGLNGYNGSEGLGVNVALNHPRGLALDGDTILFIADSNNHRIRRLDLRTGYLTTVAGSAKGHSGDGGPAAKARFYQPRGLTVSSVGDLVVADTFNSRLRTIAHTALPAPAGG